MREACWVCTFSLKAGSRRLHLCLLGTYYNAVEACTCQWKLGAGGHGILQHRFCVAAGYKNLQNIGTSKFTDKFEEFWETLLAGNHLWTLQTSSNGLRPQDFDVTFWLGRFCSFQLFATGASFLGKVKSLGRYSKFVAYAVYCSKSIGILGPSSGPQSGLYSGS